ncbi:hypothetical protein Tco_0229544, partial [Tanacetum coccineum]
MITNNNPSRGRMSPRSTIWGQAKGSLMGDPCPSAPSAISTTMARAPKEKGGGAQGNPDVNVVTGLPPTRPVEFQIYLIPGAAPVARAHRLAQSEMKELSKQLQELSD